MSKPADTRKCTKCLRRKPTNHFKKDSRNSGNRRGYCRKCGGNPHQATNTYKQEPQRKPTTAERIKPEEFGIWRDKYQEESTSESRRRDFYIQKSMNQLPKTHETLWSLGHDYYRHRANHPFRLTGTKCSDQIQIQPAICNRGTPQPDPAKGNGYASWLNEYP